MSKEGDKARIEQLMAPEGVVQLSNDARKQFNALPDDVKSSLVSLATKSNLVFRCLGAGDWPGLIRALSGMGKQHTALQKEILHVLEVLNRRLDNGDHVVSGSFAA